MTFYNHTYLNFLTPHLSGASWTGQAGQETAGFWEWQTKEQGKNTKIVESGSYTMVGSVCALSNRVVEEMAEFTFHTDLFNCSTCLHDLKIKTANVMHNRKRLLHIMLFFLSVTLHIII